MAVFNLKGFNESAKQHNITGYQLIMGNSKSGKNVKGMLVSGYMFDRLSLYTREDIDMLMEDIACNGAEAAYKNHVNGRSSKAKQKVSGAHGRFEGERLANYLQQLMTYADPFENIQFKNQTWINVLNQLVARESTCKQSEIEAWKASMKEWHANSESVCNSLIESKQIRVIDGHAIPEKTFKRFLEKFCTENGFNIISDAKMVEAINAFCNKYNKVAC